MMKKKWAARLLRQHRRPQPADGVPGLLVWEKGKEEDDWEQPRKRGYPPVKLKGTSSMALYIRKTGETEARGCDQRAGI